MKTIDPLALPDDWRERAGRGFLDIGFKEFAWHATYRRAWEECAAIARLEQSRHEKALVQAIVLVKDARIAALEKDNALLKAQLEELERALPAKIALNGIQRYEEDPGFR